MNRMTQLGVQRYLGDTRTMTVHDRWHEDCEDCLMEDIVLSGAAVQFEPDTLDQALMEDFDCCEACFGKSDPSPPDWAAARSDSE